MFRLCFDSSVEDPTKLRTSRKLSLTEQPSGDTSASKRLLLRLRQDFPPQEVEVKDALDDFCDPPGFVVGWTCEQLHTGRFYPPAAGGSGDRIDPSTNFRSTDCGLVSRL